MFYGLIAIAAVLTLISLKVSLILFRIAASTAWLALLVWVILDGTLDLSDPWIAVLAFVFLMMVIAPITLQFVTEIRREKKGKFWSEWGKAPVEKTRSRSQLVKDRHRERLKAAHHSRL